MVELFGNISQEIMVSSTFDIFCFQDQLRRYNEIKQSDLPSAVAAKKTREFRCPPREQMNAILCFKSLEEGDQENCSCGEELRSRLHHFHEDFMNHVSLKALQEPEAPEVGQIKCFTSL